VDLLRLNKSLFQNTSRQILRANLFSAAEHFFDAAVLPFLDPIKRGENKIGSGSALATDEFRAAAHVVLQPRGQAQVIRVALHLAGVMRKRGQQIGDVMDAQLDHQIGREHLAPKFGLDKDGFEMQRQAFQRVHDEQMGADVRGMPVAFVRKDNGARMVFQKQRGDGLDGGAPGLRVVLPRGRGNFFEAGILQFKPNPAAGVFQFRQPGEAAFLVASEGDGDVDDARAGFAHEPQGQAAGDAFIVRVRRDEQDDGRIGRERLFLRLNNSAQGKRLAFGGGFGDGRNKFLVRINYLMSFSGNFFHAILNLAE